MNALCPQCNQRGVFGYRDKETGSMTWYCAAHRLGQHWADARRDIQTTKNQTNNNAATLQCDQPTQHEPFVHYCHCGAWGSFGNGVRLSEGKEGQWFCAAHRPDGGNK
jgi:hypothetical protein